MPGLSRESSTLPDAPADLREEAVAERFDVVGLALPMVRTPVVGLEASVLDPRRRADRHEMRS